MEITVEAYVNAPVELAWKAWTTPEHITCWNFADPSWCCPRASLALEPGGKFSYRMEAKDGSVGFDLDGEFVAMEPNALLELRLSDGRPVTVTFIETDQGTLVTERFTAESEFSIEQQRDGWQSILNQFKSHVESLNA
ncbi:SRPBCC domain-containing protein [Vibrio sp.]|uniref:SRPBCC domain-containing protein n=1 Tax=Vibrio sp. TaxID=678 RepID=UPI003D14D1A2